MTVAIIHDENVELKAQWVALMKNEPNIRARDAAGKLKVSEMELVAIRCGDGVQRLAESWGEILQEFPTLGTIMSLTRNESAVHEKVGEFDKVSIMQNMGLVLNHDIDLRIFLNHWIAGFAVTEQTRSGLRQSFQFFDADGTAVYKLYIREESNVGAYEALVKKFLHEDQSPGQSVSPKLQVPADRPDSEIDEAVLKDRWVALQDVHDFHAMLQEIGAGRVQALRLVGEDVAYRVEEDAFKTALELAVETDLSIMIFSGNPGVIQIHTGPVKTLKTMGPWFNVLDPTFNLHLRLDHIVTAWIVKKPTRDGVVTSLEIFDADNQQIAWMFGDRKPGQAESLSWRALVDSLPRLSGVSP